MTKKDPNALDFPEPSPEEPTIVSLDQLKIREVEFQDYPNTLPHGFFVDGKRLDSLELEDYDPEFDLQLSGLYSVPKPEIKTILGKFLPKAIKSIGGMKLTDIAKAYSAPVQDLIERMPLADALTILLNLRVKFVAGMEIKMDAKCPRLPCQTRNVDDPDEYRPYHDLGKIKIGIPNHPLNSSLIVEVELEHEFYVGDDLCTIVHLRPVKVHELQKVAKMPQGKLDIALLYQQVCAIPEASILQGVKGQIFNDELYAAVKSLKDRNLLMKASRKLQELGPAMNVEMNCHACNNQWDESLGWADLRTFLFQSADA